MSMGHLVGALGSDGVGAAVVVGVAGVDGATVVGAGVSGVSVIGATGFGGVDGSRVVDVS